MGECYRIPTGRGFKRTGGGMAHKLLAVLVSPTRGIKDPQYKRKFRFIVFLISDFD